MTYLTEEEARKKWCPMARVCATTKDTPESRAHVGYNRVYVSSYGTAELDDPSALSPEIAKCIGSACMMWRFETTEELVEGQTSSEWKRVPTNRGYCGLAGDLK